MSSIVKMQYRKALTYQGMCLQKNPFVPNIYKCNVYWPLHHTPYDVVLVMICRWQWLPVVFNGLQYQSESWIWAEDLCWQLAVKCLACVTANETAKCSPHCSLFCSTTTTQKHPPTNLLRWPCWFGSVLRNISAAHMHRLTFSAVSLPSRMLLQLIRLISTLKIVQSLTIYQSVP